jgi:LytS/YehU family sensor histidine kinase
MLNKRILAFVPLVFWLILIAIKLIRIIPLYEGERLVNALNTQLITTPLDILSFALFYYVIVKHIIAKNRITLNIGIALVFYLTYGIVWSLVYQLTGRISSFEGSIIVYKSSLGHTLLSTVYAIVLRLSVDWFNKYQRQKELEKQNSITELALLRSQINPHFLFNTLNNINSFTSRDPEKTSFAIIKLSEIMRYMLYEATDEKVLIDKEIEYIHNFIALHKLRYQENDFVNFKVEGETTGLFIPPMIFLPFIENAFKHGTISKTNGIEIFLKTDKKQIIFSCKNQIKIPNETETNQIGGLGMKNIKRRLELLFPGNHELQIFNENNIFLVKLNIQLDEY